MLVVPDLRRSSDVPRGGVAALGNFDGLHLGQKAVLDEVVAAARAADAPAVVVTFEPHPLAVLRPGQAPPRILSPGQREALLEAWGIDVLAIVRFDRDLAQTRAEDFAREYLVRRLGLREVRVGSRFRFGKDREGDLETLRGVGEAGGFAVQGVRELDMGGSAISASRVRGHIQAGEVEKAALLLGRPYAAVGTIARGDRMGKRLGWPTINLAAENELLPLEGVYVCRVHFPSFPATFDCVTNIGTRPTIYENYKKVVESHILDFRSDVYGERAELAFLRRLRDERVFPSVMDLSAQIARDVEATREYFAGQRRLQE